MNKNVYRNKQQMRKGRETTHRVNSSEYCIEAACEQTYNRKDVVRSKNTRAI